MKALRPHCLQQRVANMARHYCNLPGQREAPSTWEHFPVPSGIECLTILVDNDASGTGQRAAEACAHAWLAEGREVVEVIPTVIGTDFNDLRVLKWGNEMDD